MKNLQETINEIKKVFDHDIKVIESQVTYPSRYHHIVITINKHVINTYQLRKLMEITNDYWITIEAIRKDKLILNIIIDKESL